MTSARESVEFVCEVMCVSNYHQIDHSPNLLHFLSVLFSNTLVSCRRLILITKLAIWLPSSFSNNRLFSSHFVHFMFSCFPFWLQPARFIAFYWSLSIPAPRHAVTLLTISILPVRKSVPRFMFFFACSV